MIGKRISGRYKILSMIGGGGMSQVYLAHDMILDRDVAIKILRYDFSDESDIHRRFQREALSATSLTHPNIVNIFDVGEDDDLQYLVMEYVKGKTLKEYIVESAPLSTYEAVEIMRQLTSAISHAHHHQIVHRDIKPQNILMDEMKHVKITDFGIAMALSQTSFTQTNSVLGTVHYLSPEQARGGMATKKSDIYSLGIVLYELLTGTYPFTGESAVSIALKHLQQETPSVRAIRPDIPQSLENVVMKATAKDPNHRYDSVDEMAKDLTTVLSPERLNEPKFFIPYDDDATKAMPIIKSPDVDEFSNTKTYAEPIKEQPTVAPTESKKKKRKVWPWLLGIIGALFLLFLLIFIAFPGVFGPERIEVPDLTNLSTEDALKRIETAGFIVGEQTDETSDEIEEGRVIRTIPEAGKLRDEGSKINLFISTGKEEIEMPDYVNKNMDQVDTLLNNQGFKGIDVQKSFSDQPVGTILEQQPEAGAQVIPEETIVHLVVSDGKEMVDVPDLTGYNEKALNDYAKTSGFTIVIAKEEFSDEAPSGTVISQKPDAGTSVEKGKSIEVILSKGPEAKKVKTYIQTIEIPYEPSEVPADPSQPPAEQTVKIYIQDRNHTMAEAVEEFVITKTEKKKIQLEIEEGQTAAYRILRDGKVVAEDTITYESLD